MKKYKPGIAVLFLCFLLYNCARSTEGTNASNTKETNEDSAGVAGRKSNNLQSPAFKEQSDSLLAISQKQINDFKTAMNRPENRRDIVKNRRDLIRAEYRFDILKERLDKRNGQYIKTAKKLSGLNRTNNSFQNEFNESFCELDSTINKLWKDTLK